MHFLKIWSSIYKLYNIRWHGYDKFMVGFVRERHFKYSKAICDLDIYIFQPFSCYRQEEALITVQRLNMGGRLEDSLHSVRTKASHWVQ